MFVVFLRILSLSVILFTSRTMAFAQYSTVQKSDTLGEITVKANAANIEHTSSSPLQILTQKELHGLNTLQISDAVKYLSGVVVKDYGGVGGLKTVSVRSLGANHTAVSYDGVRLNDIQTGQIDIGRFSIENAESISLSIGQNDNIFQPASLFSSASILNINTSYPFFENNRTLNSRISFKTGSFGLINPSLLFEKQISKKQTLTFGGEWLSTNGEYPYTLRYGSAEYDSIKTRKNSDVKNLRLEASLHVVFSKKSNGYTKIYYYRSERGLPGAVVLYNSDKASSQRLCDRVAFVQSHFESELSQKFAYKIDTKYNQSFLKYTDSIFFSIENIDDKYVQNEYYVSGSLLYKVSNNLSFSANNDITFSNLNTNKSEFAFPKRTSYLSVLAGKYISAHLKILATMLYSYTNERVKKGKTPPEYNKLLPYLSFSYQPFLDINLYFRSFYKEMFRVPTFNDLYYPHFGNTDLKPEDTKQINAGINYLGALGTADILFSISADAYHNTVENKIVAFPTQFKWTVLNYGIVKTDGLDMNGKISIALRKDIKLTLGNSYSYQRALIFTNSTDRDYKNQIPYTPRVSGSGRASLENPLLDVSYSVVWSGKRYILSQNIAENRLEGYFDHNISFSKNFKMHENKLYVSIEILNILNKNYEIVRSFPMPGRSLRCVIKYRI